MLPPHCRYTVLLLSLIGPTLTEMTSKSSPILGIDTGGTFTDFVYLHQPGAKHQVQVHKVLSTPHAPDEAILQGIEEMALTESVRSGAILIIHGTTVATNAALEGKGVRTAYILSLIHI